MQLYDKANSLSDLHTEAPSAGARAALERLGRLRADVLQSVADGYRASIVARALSDLFDAPRAGHLPLFALKPHVIP